jgi:PAS domain-containing protein
VRLSKVEPQLAEALHLDPCPRRCCCRPSGGDRQTSASRWCPATRRCPGRPRAVGGLIAQASLALERAQLAEDVHRQRVEARFRSLVQNATDLITVIDQEDTVRYQSPSVRRVLGYEPSDLEGRTS